MVLCPISGGVTAARSEHREQWEREQGKVAGESRNEWLGRQNQH